MKTALKAITILYIIRLNPKFSVLFYQLEENMKKFIIGLFVGVSLPFIAGYIFLITGGMPVATKGPALPMEHFIAKTAMRAAMKGEVNKPSPVVADEINLLAGVKIYKNNCAVCHGLLSAKESSIAKGLFPIPPQLFGDENVTDDPVGNIYWKVKNGIRLTGMPGFVDSLSETELWQVSLLLQNADKLPAVVSVELLSKTE